MNILRQSQRVNVERYTLDFEWNDTPGAGFSFPCDKQGNVLQDQICCQAGRENLEKCLRGEYAVTLKGVVDCSYSYLEHAQGKCYCGKTVDLVSHTNECVCGRLYNLFGQDLAPRSQWDPSGAY